VVAERGEEGVDAGNTESGDAAIGFGTSACLRVGLLVGGDLRLATGFLSDMVIGAGPPGEGREMFTLTISKCQLLSYGVTISELRTAATLRDNAEKGRFTDYFSGVADFLRSVAGCHLYSAVALLQRYIFTELEQEQTRLSRRNHN
jgi:hypothetical protein